MKLSTNIWLNNPIYEKFTFRECAEILSDAGFDAVDFPLCDWPDEEISYSTRRFADSVREAASIFAEHGLFIGQTHLPYHPGHYPPLGDGSFDAFAKVYVPKQERMLELTAQVGAPTAVIHLFFDKSFTETYDFNRRYIDVLRPLTEKTGVKIAVENIFGWNRGEGIIPCGVSTAEEICSFADYGGEMFGVCVDTGHAMLLGEDPVGMIRSSGMRLIALHINSNPGSRNRDDLHMLPGTMCWSEHTNWEKVSAALAEVGYSGTYNMELVVPYGTPKAAFPAFFHYAAVLGHFYTRLAE